MDKLREEFEEWFNKEMVLHISECDETVVRLMWKSWQASRASIVVELPKQKEDRARNCSSDDIAYGFNQGVGACRNSLRSIGLSIKGGENDYRD